jgi:peptide/nickel transport system substrate-binding protein
VTANDFVYSLTRLLKLNQSAAANFKTVGYNGTMSRSWSRRSTSGRSGSISPTRSRPKLLLYRLSIGVASVVDSVEVQKHVSNDDYGNEWLRTNSAGSGPFTLRRWSPNDLVMLDANKEYCLRRAEDAPCHRAPCSRKPGRAADAGARRHRYCQRSAADI